MKKFKSIIAVVALVTICTGVFSGCKSDTETSAGEKAHIEWWIKNGTGGVMENYADIKGFQAVADMANVEVEFLHPIGNSEAEQFNVMMASGDYPDVISYNWQAYQGGETRAVKDKVLVNLDPYMNEDYMPNYWKFVQAEESRSKSIRSSDGSINLIYGFSDTTEPNMFLGPTLRKDWLDKLGLEVPETIDEWYTVLKAFKEQDPNGNGIADEIPFTDDINACVKFFGGAWGVSNGMQLDKNGNMIFAGRDEGFKELIITIKKWYDEGLIDSEYASQNRDTMNYKMTTGVAGSYIGFSGGQMGTYLTARLGDGSGYDLVAAPWPKLTKNSPPYVGYIENFAGNLGCGITTSNQNIEATLRFFDYMFSEEGINFTNYGIEGESYEVTDDGIVYTEAIMKNPDGKAPTAALAPYAIPIWQGQGTGCVAARRAYDLVSRSYKQQQDAAKIWLGDISLHPPKLKFTSEETTRIADIFGDITTCTGEFMTRVILGTDTIDNWDKYISEIEGMGVEELEDIYQAAYDRYKKY